MEFVKNYKEQSVLRHSFNNLAKTTFGIDFEEWFQRGYWNERYIPYSFIVDNKVVANVSVNELSLLINGQEKKAIQIGTVMTDKAFRGKGLSKDLLQKVIMDYEAQVDLFYLFANHTVLDFYPKFGFHRKKEQLFRTKLSPNSASPPLRKLSIEKDLLFLEGFIRNRILLSQAFATCHSEGITLFHCIHVFSSDLYYDESNDVIFIYKIINNDLHIFDVIGKKKVSLDEVIQSLAELGDQAFLHFTPGQIDNYEVQPIESTDDVLFVKTTAPIDFPLFFKHPITSQA